MSSPLYWFSVPGLPVAKGRARSRIVTGKAPGAKSFVSHYTPADTRNFEAEVKHWAVVARRERIRMGNPHLDPDACELERGPLDLVVLFRFPVPDSWPKWKRQAALDGILQHTKKPDCSNLVKAIEDACNGVLWHDDGQVVGTVVDKAYGQTAGVHVEVYRRAGLPTDARQGTVAPLMVQRLRAGLGHRLRLYPDLLP